MRDNPEGGELDPAKVARRSCKKNSPSVFSCIGMRTREGCNRGNDAGTTHSGSDRKVSAPLPTKPKESGKRGSLEKDPILQEEQRVCPIPAMTGASGMGTRAKGSASPAPASEFASSPPGSPARLETHRKPSATREERKSEWPKYSRKTLAREMPEQRREGQGPTRNQPGKGPIENRMPSNRSDTTTDHAPVQGTQPKNRLSRKARRRTSIPTGSPNTCTPSTQKERTKLSVHMTTSNVESPLRKSDAVSAGPCRSSPQ